MTNTILILIGLSMIITAIINFMKPAYEDFVGKRNATISIGLSFALGILASFSAQSYFGLDLNTGLLIIIGLGLGTGSTIRYDIWELLKAVEGKLKGE